MSEERPLRVAQIGNFDPPHSTENELRWALASNGHEVHSYQEGDPDAWHRLGRHLLAMEPPDLILWTRTASELNRIPLDLQKSVIEGARALGVPVVALHLDIWASLPRERELSEVPYFSLVDIMCTADGGHPLTWAEHGIDHRWFPPAVSHLECEPGTFRDEYASPLAFVGNWSGHYHPEARHRAEMIDHLRARGDVAFWPKEGQPAVRGDDLRDLYASVDVLVGDSCNVDGAGFYCSDRVPETIGRGGFLLHPATPGVTDGSNWWASPDVLGAPMWQNGEHLACWEAGNWEMLDDLIENALHDHEGRRAIARAGREFTRQHHTYAARMRVLVEMLRHEGRLP